MGLREALNQHARAVTICGSTTIVIAAAIAIPLIRSGGRAPNPVFPTKMFYSADDGATVFIDDFGKTVPFDHDGAQAVRAYQYTSDGGKHTWVQYLEKFGELGPRPAKQPAETSGARLVKRPGKGQWLRMGDPGAFDIIRPRIPPGYEAGRVEPVVP